MFGYYENRAVEFDHFLSLDLTFFSHLHKQAELVYVREGQLMVMTDQKEYCLDQGDLILVFPNHIHSYRTERHSLSQFLVFNAQMAGEQADLLRQKHPVCPVLRKEQVHQDILYLLSSFLEEKDWKQKPALCKGFLEVILSRILEQMTLEDEPMGAHPDWLHQMLLYLNVHFREPLTLGQLSETLGISKYYLSRSFSEKIGCSFNTYLNSLRGEYARHLLDCSEKTVTEVGFESGFESSCTFYRVFRELYQTTPKGYRDQKGNSR